MWLTLEQHKRENDRLKAQHAQVQQELQVLPHHPALQAGPSTGWLDGCRCIGSPVKLVPVRKDNQGSNGLDHLIA